MAFVVYATYSVAIAVFVFWFGVWMLHLIAITYGKIKLHKKSRLYQKLHQHNLLQPRSRTCSTKSSHYDDLLLPSNDYHNLQQLMQQHQLQQQDEESGTPGPKPPAHSSHSSSSSSSSSSSKSKTCVESGTGSGGHQHHNKSKSSCDFDSIIGKGTGVGGGRDTTIINLNCDHHGHSRVASGGGDFASPVTSSTSSSSGISSSTSSPDLGAYVHHSNSNSTPTTPCLNDVPPMLMAAVDPVAVEHQRQQLLPGVGIASGDPLLLRKPNKQPGAELLNRLPKVSILKPLMGIDTNLAANLESFFTMDYPRQSYEILFCVESAEDPVLLLCQSLIDKYRGEVDARLFIGGEQVGVNPKINNMEPGYREAKYELVMISDAGIKMKPDTLIDMVEHMTEKVALVHQMPFTCDREGFAATYEKIFFGTIQSRIYLASDCLNVICHTGMSCLFRKKVLDALGGLRAFGCYLAEDFFMAKAIMEDGWKTTISSYPALQNSGVCDVKTFQNRLVRWAKLRIAMISYLILLEPLSECMVVGAIASWGVSILFHWDFLAFYLIHVLCWFLSDWMLLTIVQNGSVSFNKFDFVVGWLFRELSGPYLFFCALWNPAIRWRTRVYKLQWGGIANEISSSSKIKT